LHWTIGQLNLGPRLVYRKSVRKLSHQPALDGLRGIAVLLVVAVHTLAHTRLNAWHAGALGVDLFFVLSGFLITSLLLGEWSKTAAISLRTFYARRARRLLPALLTLIALFALVSIVATPWRAPQVLLLAALRASYLSNFFIASTVNGAGRGFNHLWSLAQEEQFYLLWPLSLLFLLRRGAKPKHLLAVLAVGIVAVNAERWLAVSSGASWQRIWFSPDTHGDSILFGCAAGVLYCAGLTRVSRYSAWLAGALAISTLCWFDHVNPADSAIGLPLFAFGCAVLLLASLDPRFPLLSRILSIRPLRATGRVSYGLYLWHVPMLAFFGLLGLPLAIIATLLSFRYVEQPFLGRRGAPRQEPLSPVRTLAPETVT
jgi:peptidoglycan/LPS O-acetylase OafA/YrhL